MQDPSQPSINSWFEDELLLDSSWNKMIEANGHAAAATTTVAPPAPHGKTRGDGEGDELVPLRGPALRIAENMTASLSVPVATSQRVMPVKVMDENRRAIHPTSFVLSSANFLYAPGGLGNRACTGQDSRAESGVL